MSGRIPRVPVREQDPKIRATNFKEVCLGYTDEEAMLEARRCLGCKKPACMTACPVSVKIPFFIQAVAKGDFADAARIISIDSSLPAICGRVCPQECQCEGSCVMGVKGEPVAIGKLERFVADWSRENNVAFNATAPSNGKSVAVIGSGPSGLACASDLAKMGYDVTIFEALHKAGGVLTYGIPEFRLPKDTVVAAEIESVKRLGVKIETNVVVGRTLTIDDMFDREGFHAVFVGSGAGLPKFMDIPGENLNGVVSANEFLTRNNLMKAYKEGARTPIYVGNKVCVVGGGNVAMDAARTALRLGAQVTVVYRRTEKELPARAEEAHHAKEEGIEFMMLTNPVEIVGDEKGWVTALKCERMELGEPDASGRRSPVAVADSHFNVEADVVIMALGTSPNPLIAQTTPGLERNRKGGLVATEEGATTRESVFAGGDAVTGAATVILAMGAGRKAAAAIDEYLKNKKMKKAYVFPGQGSQFVGMGKDLYDNNSLAKDLFDKANEILGFKITDIMFEGTDEDLKQTKVTQPAVFLHSVISALCLGDDFKPDMVAGHSLGEFSALVAAGALSFEDGLRLVYARAMAMQACCEKIPGAMAAIINLPDETIEQVCSDIDGVVVPVNYNSPGQVVISGEVTAVKEACKKLKDAGAKRALQLPVGGAYHSPLMEEARVELAAAIEKAEFHIPCCPIYQNVDAKPYIDPIQIKANLLEQLTSAVRWTHTVLNMKADGMDEFVECGPGQVLTGLIGRIL